MNRNRQGGWVSIAAAVVSAYASHHPQDQYPERKETAGEEAERWYNERKQVYAKDYSKPWFTAAKVTALLGIIMVAILWALQ